MYICIRYDSLPLFYHLISTQNNVILLVVPETTAPPDVMLFPCVSTSSRSRSTFRYVMTIMLLYDQSICQIRLDTKYLAICIVVDNPIIQQSNQPAPPLSTLINIMDIGYDTQKRVQLLGH